MTTLAIFPALPGRSITVERDPVYRIDEIETVGQRVQTIDWGLAPRHHVRVGLNFLRSASAHRELQTLAGFYARMRANAGVFLFQDPQDYQVSDHGFGVGDGARTAFQLQRRDLGTDTDVLGTWERSTKPRTNWVSTDLTTWSAVTAGSGVPASVAGGAAMAPDGTPTAAVLSMSLAGGTTLADRSGVYRAAAATGAAWGWGTFSVWLRCPSGTALVGVSAASGTYTYAAVDEVWRRFTHRYEFKYTGTAAGYIELRGSIAGVSPVATVEVWNPQYELTPAPDDAPTSRMSGTATPAYWPALGDGFEPVYEPDPRDLALYVEGDGLGRRPLSRVARTNVVVRSAEINAWSLTSAAVTQNAASAPDATPAVADKLTETAVAGAHGAYLAGAVTMTVGRRYTLSVYLRAAERTEATVALGVGAFGGDAGGVFDLAAGVVSSVIGPAGTTATIEAVGGGWFRCSASAVCTAAAAGGPVIYLRSGGTGSYLGVAGSGLFVWGAMIEVSSVAGDYIPTTTAAVTRTDAVLGAAGAVTLAAAPRAGAALSWSGSFWRRCRFAGRLPVERWLAEVWRTGAIDLVEDLP